MRINDKTFLVTGGSGFIGSHFIRLLRLLPGFSGKIINLDNLSLGQKDPHRKTGAGTYLFRKTDISDKHAVYRIVRKHNPDIIVNFAAATHVDDSIRNPDPFLAGNIMGTANLLEAVRKCNARAHLHQVSTDEVFGSTSGEELFSEQSPYAPGNPYAASKAAADHLVRAWSRTHGIRATISCSTNNYGPGQHHRKLIPLLASNIFAGKPLPIYGDGRNIREWLYVEDHCHALLAILERGEPGKTYLIGSGERKTNIEMAEILCQSAAALTGREPEDYLSLIKMVNNRPGHDRKYAVDSSMIRDTLGWFPRTGIREGLTTTLLYHMRKPQKTGMIQE